MPMRREALSVLLLLAVPTAAITADVPSRPSVEAPQLAALGPYDVGVKTIRFQGAPDTAEAVGRTLAMDVWYPAQAAGRRGRFPYAAALPAETPGRWARFTIPALARREAPAARGGAPYPLVVLSHGYSGSPVELSWLAENLASKGYVVAAPRHEDPPITDPSKFALVAYRRPLDIAATLAWVQAQVRSAEPFWHDLADPDRVALAGYSMGGYGALTIAGAGLSPAYAAAVSKDRRRLDARRELQHVQGVRAVVVISPAGGSGIPAWDAAGLAQLRTPILAIVGDQDKVVGYAPGVRTIFDGAVNARRDLLVFREAGHSIGMDPAPAQMRQRLWDLDWFEDPVWRKSRVIGVNLHMITAFLGLHLKEDPAMAAFLAVTPRSDEGAWPPSGPRTYGAYSPGGPPVTVWKGFQRVHAAGLELIHKDAGSN
jgi:predicted dienelactone hydrolase